MIYFLWSGCWLANACQHWHLGSIACAAGMFAIGCIELRERHGNRRYRP